MGATMGRKTPGSLKNLPTNVKHTHADSLLTRGIEIKGVFWYYEIFSAQE
jgi:hypothetical protein